MHERVGEQQHDRQRNQQGLKLARMLVTQQQVEQWHRHDGHDSGQLTTQLQTGHQHLPQSLALLPDLTTLRQDAVGHAAISHDRHGAQDRIGDGVVSVLLGRKQSDHQHAGGKTQQLHRRLGGPRQQ